MYKMHKISFQTILFVCLLLLSCAKKEDKIGQINPFDTQGDNYYPPTVYAMPDTSIPVYDTIALRATGKDTNGGYIAKYIWSRDGKVFPDTVTEIFKVRFTKAGLFPFYVKAIDNEGVKSKNTDSVFVTVKWYKPTVALSPKNKITGIGDTVVMKATAQDTNGAIQAFYWALDGSNFSTTPGDSVVKIAYASPGTKRVLVKAVDDDALEAFDSVMVFVKDKAPLLTEPLNKAVLTSWPVVLRWYPGFYNHHYSVLLDKATSPITVIKSSTPDTSFSPVQQLGKATLYYWRVVGYDNTGGTDTSETWCFTTANTEEIPVNGLVAYWPFNGNAKDESGNGNDGTVNGAFLAKDRFALENKAYFFNGIDNFIRIKNNNSFDLDAAITISAWIKTDLTQISTPIVIAGKWGDEGDYDNNRSYTLLLSSKDSIEFAFSTTVSQNSNSFQISRFAIQQSVSNRWVYISATYDGSMKRLFVNGELIGTTPRSGLIHKGIADLGIGAYLRSSTHPTAFLKGYIDDIRIYNRALTESEIQALYHEGGYVPPLDKPSLSAWGIDSTKIQIKWNRQSGANNYTLESASSSTGSFGQIFSGADTTYTHTGLVNNQKVWYRVKATNVTQFSEWSDTVSAIADAIPINGLVAYYPFNGNAKDESGNGNDGVVNGATMVLDRFGAFSKAYAFDGQNDFIQCGSNAVFDVNHHTIACWVYLPTLNSQENPILNKAQPWTYETIDLSLDSGKIRTVFATGTEVNHPISGDIVLLHQWHFVALSYDGNNANLFIDTLKSVSISRNGTVRTNRDPLSIGRHNNADTYFLGSIDDLRIYNRALTESEIQALYHEGGWPKK